MNTEKKNEYTIDKQRNNHLLTMEQILIKIGVNTELLNREPIHNRETIMRILGISHTTLKKYENENILQSSRFKRKKYYTKEAIIDCVKSNLNLSKKNVWEKMWE